MKFNPDDYKGKVAMHCRNKEELEDFVNYLIRNGHKDKTPYSLSHCYYGANVFYFNSQTWSDITYAERNGYTILKWEDFMKETFTKADLKTGDVVLQRNGNVEIVNRELGMLICKDGWNDLDDVCNDLTFKLNRPQYDIVAVRRPKEKSDCNFKAFTHEWGTLVYDRNHNEPEEMTLAEVCRLLGKEIKIIK